MHQEHLDRICQKKHYPVNNTLGPSEIKAILIPSNKDASIDQQEHQQYQNKHINC